jgi:hypothetical protein
MNNPIASTLRSILSYGFILILYINALNDPANNKQFIVYGSAIVLLMEYLGMHASNTISGAQKDAKSKIIILSLYAFLAIGFSFVTQAYWIFLAFFASVVAKLSRGTNFKRDVLIPSLSWAASGLAAAAAMPTLLPYLNIPDSSLNGSTDPVTIVLWGLFYFSLLIMIQLFILFYSLFIRMLHRPFQ